MKNESKSGQYFYHLKPKKLVGNKLIPLSKIKNKSHKEKYKGRPELENKKIPLLDCAWDDVIFFSCLNPSVIFMSLELLGLFEKKNWEILKFPIESLDGKEFCYYLEDNNEKEKFKKISIDSYKETKHLPPETAKYFIDCVKSGEDPLIFSCVPHLLLKGELDVSLAKDIKYFPLEF